MLNQFNVDSSHRLDNLFDIASFQDQLPWQPFRPGIEIYPLNDTSLEPLKNPETE
jgi:hypothetical protein